MTCKGKQRELKRYSNTNTKTIMNQRRFVTSNRLKTRLLPVCL